MSKYEIKFPFMKNFNSYNIMVCKISYIYFGLLTYFPKEFCGPSVLQTSVDVVVVLTPPT